ncbi:MAG: hypothetical protein HC904_06595, partial [Blastochloris sp.]|nr:hypothetical protein [Blastochloris sp.]
TTGSAEASSNTFERITLGVEGKPAPGWEMLVRAGPDFRHYGAETPLDLERDPVLWFVEAKVTGQLGPADRLTLWVRRMPWLASTGRTPYEDSIYDLEWSHRFDSRWSLGVGARAAHGGTEGLRAMDDWILSTRGTLSCRLDSHWSARLELQREMAESGLPGKAGREYQRSRLSLAMKWNY